MRKKLVMPLRPDGCTLHIYWPYGDSAVVCAELRALYTQAFPGVDFGTPFLGHMTRVYYLRDNDTGLIMGAACQAGSLRAWQYARRNELAWVVTAPQFRRLGVAECLCRYVLFHIQAGGSHTATVVMNPATPEAEALYRKLGFKEAE